MVEGAGHKRADHGGYLVRILENFRRSYPEHLISILFHEPVPMKVAYWVVTLIMHRAIDFNDQLQAAAIEVRDIIADRMLSSKFKTSGLPSQALPQ